MKRESLIALKCRLAELFMREYRWRPATSLLKYKYTNNQIQIHKYTISQIQIFMRETRSLTINSFLLNLKLRNQEICQILHLTQTIVLGAFLLHNLCAKKQLSDKDRFFWFFLRILTVGRNSCYNGQYKALPGGSSALNFQILDPHWLCPEISNSKPDILGNPQQRNRWWYDLGLSSLYVLGPLDPGLGSIISQSHCYRIWYIRTIWMWIKKCHIFMTYDLWKFSTPLVFPCQFLPTIQDTKCKYKPP